jgi:cob(I)alamin adenosyltransferase
MEEELSLVRQEVFVLQEELSSDEEEEEEERREERRIDEAEGTVRNINYCFSPFSPAGKSPKR